ncbi:MAG: hypothetical protein AB1806_05785 [Acidobacteriota bacterium]
MSNPKKAAPSTQPPEPPAFIVPRAWLITLTVLIVIPWLIAGTLYLWRGLDSAPAVLPADDPPSREAASGPWGVLEVSPIVISPPIELIDDDWARDADAGKYWFLPDTGLPVAEVFLSSTGLSREQVSRLLAASRPEPRINGIVIEPDPDLARSLAPDVRARLYIQLAKSPLNLDQVQAFRYHGESADAWLGPSLIAPATRRLVNPLTYRHGEHVYFADQALVRPQIADAGERRRLAKALLRQLTVRVRLSVPSLSEVPGLATYWGRGGRRTDIRPLLESIVGRGADRSLDIVHLLPAFARERLYRYPRLTAQDLDRPVLANCLWSALNFFNTIPDDRYLDVNVAVERLKQDYTLIENHYELGDIVALVDERGNIFHAVVYLADDLVFTKNGTSPVAPWVILPLDIVVDYYRPRSEKPQLIYHRRKDF